MLANNPVGTLPLRSTPLIFGSAPLATQFWGNNERDAIDTAVAAITAGITWFDTAPLYGSGEAEERLGRALSACGDPDVVVATKVGRPVVQTAEGRGSTFDYSRDGTLRSLDDSLERLGRSHVDVVHVHDPDDHLADAIEDCLPTLVQLREEGVIRAVSVGTVRCDTAMTLLTEAEPDLMMIAGRLTLLDNTALDELAPACARRGVPLLAAAIFNSGLLARPEPGTWFDYAPADADRVRRAQAMADVCRSYGVSLRAAALQYPLRFEPVFAVVVGMATAAEVAENIELMEQPIPAELWDALIPANP
jgi:D-threo-aldose 1-dehydrogenase